MSTQRSPRGKARRSKPRAARKAVRSKAASRGFVGRDASPVLDHYPAKDPSLSVRGPPGAAPGPVPTAAPAASPAPSQPGPSSVPPVVGTARNEGDPASRPIGLISLERPFDVDEFASLLGQSSIRVQVPRESLAEVLRRISEFMGFGIYVYSVRVRPEPAEMLKRFVVELERVDFSPEKGDWVPFEDRGRSDSPFGPSGDRR